MDNINLAFQCAFFKRIFWFRKVFYRSSTEVSAVSLKLTLDKNISANVL